MRGATSTLGPLPCSAAVMRSVIGDSFLKAANATGRRCPFAQASPSPRTKGVLTGHCHGPCVTNPNERRSRACSSAKAPPTLAGRGRGPAQSSARSPAISRNAPGAPGPASAAALPWREAMARFERHGSELAARPDVAWGPTADPEGSCDTRPRGDRSWRCSTAQLRVRPGGSGCATQGDARGPSSALRTVLTATDPWEQSNAEPPLTPSPERVPRIAHAALGCAILVQG